MSEADPGHQQTRFYFKELAGCERARWVAGLSVFCAAAAALESAVLEHGLGPSPRPRLVLVYVPAALGILAIGVGLWLTRRGRGRGFVGLTGAGVWLPVWRLSKRPRFVPYEAVESLGWFAWGLEPRYFVGTSALASASFPLAWFEDASAIDRIDSLVREGIARSPDGALRLARIERRRAVSDAARAAPVRITLLVAAGLIAAIAFQQLSGSLDDKLLILWQGPLVWWQLRDPGPFVLVSSGLLHVAVWHFAINWIGLVVLGRMVEPILGWARFVVVLLGGGLLASLFVGVFSDSTSLGFSIPLASLLGAYAASSVAKRADLGVPYRMTWQTGLALVASVALISGLVGGAGHVAHVAGFVAGLLVAWPLMHGLDPLAPDRDLPGWIRASAILVATLYAVALGQWIHHLATTEVIDTLRVARGHWDDPRFGSDLAVGLAMAFSLEERATARDLEIALARLRREQGDSVAGSMLSREALLESIGHVEARLAVLRAGAVSSSAAD